MTKVNETELAGKMMKAVFLLRTHAGRPDEPHMHGPHGSRFPHPEGMPGQPPIPPLSEREHKPPHGRHPMGRERILTLIGQHPDGIHQKDILKEAHIGPSSLSELIDKLESDGYLERRIDPDDKRATLLFLTDKGKARAAEVEDEQNAMLKDYFKNLSDEEKETLSLLLDKILA